MSLDDTDIGTGALAIEPPATSSGRAWGVVVASTIIELLVISAIMLVIGALLSGVSMTGGTLRIGLMATGSLVARGILLLLLLTWLRRDGLTLRDLGLRLPSSVLIWTGAVTMMPLFALGSAYQLAAERGIRTDDPNPFAIFARLAPTPGEAGVLLLSALASVAATIVVELVYRGLMISELKRARFGAAAQVAIPALMGFLVALAPLRSISGEPGLVPLVVGQAIVTLVVGALLGAFYLTCRRSIAAPILLSWLIHGILVGPVNNLSQKIGLLLMPG